MIKRVLLYLAVLAAAAAVVWALLRPAPYRSLLPEPWGEHEAPVVAADSLVSPYAARETIE